MGLSFGTDAWVKALMVEVNNSEGYRKAAHDWEGDFYFVINKSPGFTEETYLYLDLWHGACRDAFKVEDVNAKDPAFLLAAPSAIWQRVLSGKLDPIQGLVTRQLKLKGNMMKIMKAPKAATELVAAAQKVDTEWPK